MKIKSILFIATLTLSTSAIADQYHYKDILLGERAFGLGGAFTAISDDPSGMYYNPAGIIFAFENYFSLAANAYNATLKKYENIVSGQNYFYRSQGLIPTFFGFTQSVGNSKWGFAIAVTNADSIDQEDSLNGLTTSNGTADFKRKFYRSDTTFLVGPAFATELFENFTVGLSAFALIRSDKVIDHQYVMFTTSGKYFFQHMNRSRTVFSFFPKLGFQFMPVSKLSLGLTFSKAITVTGSGSQQLIRTALSGSTPVTQNGTFTNDVEMGSFDNIVYAVPSPFTITAGAAYFFSKRLAISADFDFNTADTEFTEFTVNSVMNVAVGAEWYPSDSMALRLGGFTNNSNTPALVAGSTDQEEHVNLMGLSSSVSFLKPGSSLSIGASYSFGKGQGQAIGGSTSIQDVYQYQGAIFLTAGYQL